MPGCSLVQSLCRPDGARVCVPSRPIPPLTLSLLLPLFLLWLQLHGSAAAAASSPCPRFCECSEPPTRVKCVNRQLSSIPSDIPAGVERLFITGNSISTLGAGAFGQRLEHLLNLNLSDNKIESIEALAFASMPSLRQLDLSNNRISTLHPEAFGGAGGGVASPHSLQELNLSRALLNGSVAEQVSDLLQNGSLANLVHLEMSDNDLFYMPARAFSRLTSLRQLQLRNNSFVSFRDTFQDLNLQLLDLRFNALKTLGNGTMAELSSQPQLRVDLRDNPFVCDCGLKDFRAWLQSTDKVVEKDSLLCSSPESLGNKPVLQARYSDLQCSFQGDMESALQTSYVFLGLVLALIGVIFMFVLYLNRKGIKKWLNNFRDACRDHMEGYHYRTCGVTVPKRKSGRLLEDDASLQTFRSE
ncbi:trophoblast glycoprotein b isoform X1 [Leucoraja erinacea]|uniref:trophoblast glycoprotein b isoform X1 n=1 Tax=Leucoraja erinaceus TaxID=7782 RepID=UPI00245634D1|nr:trophoblast glycoprotein b isoform X1 [Leucoraja erinacea]XP_055492046.1 trophoblast glycoprotein b isoform X1 [Leucoraja erinacea]